jgi:hypothetical protein
MANTDRTLDWKPRFDDRSRSFPIRGAVALPSVPARKRLQWAVPPVPLNQGREGACVGFGWTHEAMATPVRVVFADGEKFARDTYRAAQRIDEWEGEAYEGTSVLAGAKVLVDSGYLKEYRWAFSPADVVLALHTSGPVVLGVNWYESMYGADHGIVRVDGALAGGHCILARAWAAPDEIFPDEQAIGLYNSWGPSWGDKGRAWMRYSDLERLMREGGEACVPFRRSYGRVKITTRPVPPAK